MRCSKGINADKPDKAGAKVRGQAPAFAVASRWKGGEAASTVGGYDPGYLLGRWVPFIRAHGPGQGQLP